MISSKLQNLGPLKTALAIAIIVWAGQTAKAGATDISASERGWVCDNPAGNCGSTNNGADPANNYFAGGEEGTSIDHTRNWFEFAIPDLTGQILTSATLLLDDGPLHLGGDLTFDVYGLGSQPTVFSDVSTSDPFGSVATNDGSSDTTLSIALNPGALAAIVADQGGNLFIGGIDSAETIADPCAVSAECYVGDFATTFPFNGPWNTVLVLTTAPDAPEPCSLAVLGTALAGFGFVRRRGAI